MERKLFQVAVGLTWLALPLTLLNYWRAWDQLAAASRGALRHQLAAQRLYVAGRFFDAGFGDYGLFALDFHHRRLCRTRSAGFEFCQVVDGGRVLYRIGLRLLHQ